MTVILTHVQVIRLTGQWSCEPHATNSENIEKGVAQIEHGGTFEIRVDGDTATIRSLVDGKKPLTFDIYCGPQVLVQLGPGFSLAEKAAVTILKP